MITIMILGGGVMQIPAIRISKEKGWRVIVADGNPDVPGRRLADAFESVDLKDLDGMVSAARAHLDGHGLDGVFTAGTDFSTTVAWVAERLGLPGIGYETALNATDKTRMRRKFTDAGVPSPRFIRLDADESGTAGSHTAGSCADGDVESVLGTIDFPMVVKPVDNMGARGIRRIDTPGELRDWLPEAFRFSRSGAVIVEEFVPGPEYSIDAIVENGSITICGFADRHITFEPYFVEMGHTIPSEAPQDLIREMTTVFTRGVEALGITLGAAKGDVKYSPDGPVIGEIAARLSGGYMSGWTFPYSSGVEVTAAALNLSVGLPAGDLTPEWEGVSAERAYISIPGVVDEISGIRDAERIVGVKNVLPRIAVGDSVRFPTNNVQKCGNIISQSYNRESAVRSVERGLSEISIRLRPGSEETIEYLFRRKDTWPPPAFMLHDQKNLSILSSMPRFRAKAPSVPKKRGYDPECRKISICELPNLSNESGRDWHGFSLLDAFVTVQKITGIVAVPWDDSSTLETEYESSCTAGCILLGSIFWHGMIRGGYQGGLFVVDTIMSLYRQARLSEIKETLQEWCQDAFSS